jgi:hypothetical protein
MGMSFSYGPPKDNRRLALRLIVIGYLLMQETSMEHRRNLRD